MCNLPASKMEEEFVKLQAGSNLTNSAEFTPPLYNEFAKLQASSNFSNSSDFTPPAG
jgi:hypothetical protein